MQSERPQRVKYRSMPHARLRVHLALAFVQITFGALHVTGKAALAHVPPLALAGMRVLGATPLVILCALAMEKARPSRSDWTTLGALGFLGVFVNQLAFILGLSLTSAANAAILMPTIPVFATGFGLLMRIERPSLPRLAGVACAAAGALVMVGTRPPAAGWGFYLGNALLLLNCLSYALYMVLQKPLLGRLGPLTVVGGAFLAGGLGILVVSIPALARLAPLSVPPAAWAAVLYIILIPTALNYVLNSWAIRESGPTLAAAYITLQPLAAALLAALWLGERPGIREGAGAFLILSGLALVARAGRRAARTVEV